MKALVQNLAARELQVKASVQLPIQYFENLVWICISMYLCVGGKECVYAQTHVAACKIKGTYNIEKDTLKNGDVVLLIWNSEIKSCI